MSFNMGRWSLSALFHYKAKIKREPVKKHTVLNPYHAVSVASPLIGACRAAEKCNGRRFLSSEAPHLPLSGCDALHCHCRYQHHEDRRSEESRRVSDDRGLSRVWNGAERRATSGRRISDL